MTCRHLRPLLVLLLALAGALAARAGDLPHVVSLNVCTDQPVLALAEPGQILALSPHARRLGFAAGVAGAWPHRVLAAPAEETLRLAPDLVIASSFDRAALRAFLLRRGLNVATFDPPDSIAAARDEIVRLGRLLRAEERAQDLVAAIDAALARARGALQGRRLSALYLARRGYVAGPQSLVGDLVARIGFDNAAERLGIGFGATLALERVLALRPDILVVAAAPGETVLPPALARLYPPERRIALDPALTLCGGPGLVAAIDGLAAEAARVARGLAAAER